MGGGSSWDSSSSYDWSDSSRVTKKSAKAYSNDDNRTYSSKASKVGIKPKKGKDISTDSSYGLILCVDITGSMEEWPKMIFEKIPALYNESNAALQNVDVKTLKKGKTIEDLLEIAVIAIGDAKGDSYPIQVVDFNKGKKLVEGVDKIYPEGRGGSNGKESYDLAAYYLLNHCNTPNIAKPLVIFAGDEGLYDTVDSSWVKKHIGDDLSDNLNTKEVMMQLAEKFDCYILRPEPCPTVYGKIYPGIQSQWREVFGHEKVLKMDDPNRLVDCIVGICAYAADNFDEGVKMLERRQTKAQVQEVLKTLHPLINKK